MGCATVLVVRCQRKRHRRAALRTLASLIDLSHARILNHGRRQVHSKWSLTDSKFYSDLDQTRHRSTPLGQMTGRRHRDRRASSRCKAILDNCKVLTYITGRSGRSETKLWNASLRRETG